MDGDSSAAPPVVGSTAAGPPAWALLLLGWSLTSIIAAERQPLEALQPPAPTALALPARLPEGPHPSQVRAVRGVGAARSVRVAVHLWNRAHSPGGGWADLEAIPGVGPFTARALQGARGR